jgi:hypothetical protein
MKMGPNNGICALLAAIFRAWLGVDPNLDPDLDPDLDPGPA